MTETPLLISHPLCPYVQRVAIAFAEKNIAFDRRYVDLGDKPAWFTAISPPGKVPLLQTGGQVIFESSAILEYVEDTEAGPLHPADPLRRARHRAWMEFGSGVLNDIGGFYSAPDRETFDAKARRLVEKFNRIEDELGDGPWFSGADFSLVDTVFGPVFRYFDIFDEIGNFGILSAKPKLHRWRANLVTRPSIIGAVRADYPERLVEFLMARNSHLSTLIEIDERPSNDDHRP